MKTYNVVFERFDSIDKLVKANRSRKVNKVWKEALCSSLHTDKETIKFAGTKSYDEAEGLLVNGWNEHIDKFKSAAKVSPNVRRTQRKPATGVVGYAPNVPNAIRGLPNSMISTETVKQKVKAVTIVYSPCVNSKWKAQEIVECGVAVMKIINLLEAQGIRAQLSIEGMSTVVNNDWSVVWVDVKNWRESLDLKKLMFPVVSPSMLRRIGFRWLETNPDIKNRRYTYGYGTPIGGGEYQGTVKIMKHHGLLKENEYYITAPACRENGYDPDKIMEFVGMAKLKQRSA